MPISVARIIAFALSDPDMLLSYFLTAFTVCAIDIDWRRMYANQNSTALTVDGYDRKIEELCYRHHIKRAKYESSLLCPKCTPEQHLGTFTTDTACQLDVLWHDCHSLSMNRTEIRIYIRTNKHHTHASLSSSRVPSNKPTRYASAAS